MQFQVAAPVFSLGWLVALLVLILAIVFLVIGGPDAKVLLFMIGGLAVARLL